MTSKPKDPYQYHIVEDCLDRLTEKELKKLFLRVQIKIINLVFGKRVNRNDIKVYLPPSLKKYYLGDSPFQLVTNNFVALVSKSSAQ